MNRDLSLVVLTVLLGATGVFLMLPHRLGVAKPRTAYAVGAGLAGLALLLFGWTWAPPGPWVSGLFFYACAFAAVACGALTITSRDPVHSALWFAAVVLSASGLFLLAGASFLAAGTVIVYAGAIIVTFLFVIMLAQMEGRALYDRAARAPFWTTWVCFALFLGVVLSVVGFRTGSPARPGGATAPAGVAVTPPPLRRSAQLVDETEALNRAAVQGVLDRSVRSSARIGVLMADNTVAPKPHVAGLGETLYQDHLLTVELAGALLFVALVGAIAIAAPKPPARRGETRTTADLRASTAEPVTAEF